MFEEAPARGTLIGKLATFEPSVASMPCDARAFSTSRAEAAVAASVPCAVLTSPASAVIRLRRAIENAHVSPAREH